MSEKINPLRQAALDAVIGQGMDNEGQSPHSWRCEFPDRYPGRCTCPQDMADAVVDAVAQHVLGRPEIKLDEAPAGQWVEQMRQTHLEIQESARRDEIAGQIGNAIHLAFHLGVAFKADSELNYPEKLDELTAQAVQKALGEQA